MRLIVRNYVATAFDRQRTDLERSFAGHLRYPDAFPLDLFESAVGIREIGSLKIVAQFRADYPQRTSSMPEAVLGRRKFAFDIELDTLGTHC